MTNDLIAFPLGPDTPIGIVLQQLNMSVDRLMELKNLNTELSGEMHSITEDEIPISEIFAVFIADWNVETGHRKSLADLSKETYLQITELLKAYLLKHGGDSMPANEFYRLCNKFVTQVTIDRNLSVATRNKYAAVIRRLEWFCYENYAPRRPNLPRIEKLKDIIPQALSDNEIKHLIFAAKQGQFAIRSHFMVSFLLSTGLRRAEFLGAQLHDIGRGEDGPFIRVRHAKGGVPRNVPLYERTMGLLSEYCDIYDIVQPTDYLYGHHKFPHRQLEQSTLDREFQRIAKRMPTYNKMDKLYRFHLHTLRHTYAKMMLLSGVQLRVIADLLGHQ